MQRTIYENQKVIAERQEAKIEQVFANGYKFKKRGNEEQFKHNAKVMAKIKEANEEMVEKRIQEARQKISEGYDLIQHRQKLIKLADSSAAGWKALDEYVKKKPIASDSENKKRISKTQTRAERKAKDERIRRRERYTGKI